MQGAGTCPARANQLCDRSTSEFYRRALEIARAAGLPFLVGGGFALEAYTGIGRSTKDIDIFVCERDFGRALDAFGRAGFRTERTFPHWLGKVYAGDLFVDLIFNSGN